MQDGKQEKSNTASQLETYRLQVRATFGRLSDKALLFQDARVHGGIDREELDREINRRGI